MTAQLSGVGSAGHRTHAELRSRIQSGTMDKTQKITAANMPQKGKMRKIQPEDNCGKYAEKGKMRKIQPTDNCGKYAAERENAKNTTSG